ncbi:MAG: hypothetical protein LBV75_02850, partial [Paludibacter sp.]|nr:hypothetical protein [Paludibacter sp.]
MAKRLNQAIKEFNIGKDTIIAFLAKKGHSIADDPNAKLDDDQFFLLAKEFDKDRAAKLEAERLSASLHQKDTNEKPRAAKSETKIEKPVIVEDKQIPTPEVIIEPVTAPAPISVPETKIVETQQIDTLPKAEIKPEPEIKQEIKPEPITETIKQAEIIPEPKVEQKIESKIEPQQELAPKIQPDIQPEPKVDEIVQKTETESREVLKTNVVGHIDLNQFNKPKKEERNRDRRNDKPRDRRDNKSGNQKKDGFAKNNNEQRQQPKPERNDKPTLIKTDRTPKPEKTASAPIHDPIPFRYSEPKKLKGITLVDQIEIDT